MSLMWSMAAKICGLKILNLELSEHSIMFSFSKALLISLPTSSVVVNY